MIDKLHGFADAFINANPQYQPGDVSKSIKESVNGLYPTWTTVVATLVAVLILMLVLTKLVYKPVKKNFQDRRNYIQNNIDQAELQNKEAIADRETANDELIAARSEAAQIITAAKVEAEEVRAAEIARAKEDASKLVSEAKEEIVSQKAAFEVEKKEAIVEVALAAAAEVVEKEVDNKTNRKLVEDFINNK